VRTRARWTWLIFLVAPGVAGLAHADPWLAPGDVGLRSDIQLLADSGILRGPVTTWPLSWPDIARDVLAANESDFDAPTAAALTRVRRLARDASSNGFAGLGIRARGTNQPTLVRDFEDTPREKGELTFRASWLTSHFALNLQGSAVTDPDDEKQFRADGSYLGVNVGNFMISAGFMERWWGPAWDGALALSTNARPIPSLTLERNYTDPFKSKWLSWIGPWRASVALGETESADLAVPHVKFLAARVNFKPRHWLEFGLTRTAQFCGGDRPCDWQTFTDMLFGRDNLEEGQDPSEEPGNQMAGFDMRLRSPWKALPIALYTQWIGEDEAGGFPSRFLGQFGLEFWGGSPLGGYRLRAEFVDTACNFARDPPDYNCAYRHAIYPQGYTYRGRIIGHSLDNDSRMISIAGVLSRTNGDVLSIELRHAQVNRDGGGTHAISDVPSDLDNVELRYSKVFGIGKVSIGLGYDDWSAPPESASNVRGSISWQQGF
jgi:hypothetical protein